MNGFVAQAESGRRSCCNRHIDSPKCSLVAEEAGRHGLPRLRARSRTTGRTRATSSSRTTCSSRRVVEPARAPVHGLGLVGALLAARRPDELRQRGAGAGLAAGRAARTRRAATPDYAWTDLTYLLHKYHVSWRYYVFKGYAARLRRRRRCSARRCRRTRRRRGSGTRCRGSTPSSRTASGENVAPFDDFLARRSTGTCRRSRGSRPAQAVSEHPPALDQRRPGVRDRRDQRDHAQPGLELDRDLPRLGRLGRFLRPRAAARRRRARLRAARARRS